MGLKQTGLPRYLTPDPATLYKSGPQFGTTGVDPDIVRAPLRLSRACLGKSAATCGDADVKRVARPAAPFGEGQAFHRYRDDNSTLFLTMCARVWLVGLLRRFVICR